MEGISALYIAHFGAAPDKFEEIPCSVSTRRYFRLFAGKTTVIGTYSPDIRETAAFTTFARHFHKKGINVPEIIAVSDNLEYYLQTDLGDVRMHELIVGRKEKRLDSKSKSVYLQTIKQLVHLQVNGYEGLDFSISVPRPSFDRQAIMWDLNHFKYYFLKPLGISYDENVLEESFRNYADYLAQLPMDSFMFRDFQTRNIMLVDELPYFIDFQGGRCGPLQYDLASLLFEAKTEILEADRTELIDYYISEVTRFRNVDPEEFKIAFYKVALIRILQVLGTYGLRGLVEKKAVFIQSIPIGLKNLEYILKKIDGSILAEPFRKLLIQLTSFSDSFQSMPEKYDGLTIQIVSFSYRKPLPDDISGNGGGFVYDCRFLNNPGLHEALKNLTGLDNEVQAFLRDRSDAHEFIESIKDQLQSAITSYRSRKYTNLMVSFGCTGGRHRSVYVARAISDWCRQKHDLRVFETHREIGLKF